jgi:hypothetical protein
MLVWKVSFMDYSIIIVGIGYPLSVIGAYLVASRMFAGEEEE